MAASSATAASQLHRRLFYAKWETPSQQQQQQQRNPNNNNDDRVAAANNNESNNEETAAQPQEEQQQQVETAQQQPAEPEQQREQQQQQESATDNAENENRVIMIFDSPTHWQEGEYERATQDQPQADTNNNAAAAAAPPADDDADAAQQILAMERTMEAMSRRYMDNVVSQMRGTDGENGDDDRPARIMIGGLGGAMLMGGGPRVAAGPVMGPFPPDLAMAMGAAMRGGGAPAIPLPRVINPPMGLFGPRRQNNNNNNNNNGGGGGALNNNGGGAPNNNDNNNNNDAQPPRQGDPQQEQQQAPNPAAAAANNNNNNDGVPNANAPAVGEDQQQQQPNNNENNNNDNNNNPPDDGVGGIGRALGDLVRRAFRMGRPGQPPRPRRRPREEPAGENGNGDNNDERPRRRARRQAGERREPAAAMMVEVRMVQGPDGRLIPLMPQMGRAGGGGGAGNNNNNENQAAPDPFHHLIADALNQAMGQMQGGPQQQQQQGANQNQNGNNNNGQQEGANQNDNDGNNNAPRNPPPADQNNGGNNNNNNNEAPANPPGQGPNANNNDNNAQNNNNNNNPHQAIGEAIAQAIRQAMMGGPPQPNNNNNAAGNNNNDNNGQNNNNNNGPPRGMPRPFRVNVNLRGANGNNNGNGNNNNNDGNNNNNDGPARVGFGAIPMPVFDMGQVMSSQQTHPKWTLEQLQQTLERKHHAAKTLHFDVMEGSWDSMPKEDWKQVCQKLAAALPNVTSMQVTYVEHLKDAKWAMLLSHFPNLTSLSFKHIGAMPYTFRQIGALKRLTHLSLQDDTYARSSSSGLTPVACIALAKALLKLKSLSNLTIKHLIMQDPRACWIPLLKAIRKIPTIAQLQVNGGWQQRPAGNRPGAPLICHRINLSPGNMDKMQYGPRISAARKEFLSSDEPTVANWMEAFASVGDRIDCVHYLVTQMDPSDLARAGLEGAAAMEQQPEQQQKQEEVEMEIVD